MKLEIESLDEGYIVKHEDKRYAFMTIETVIQKIQNIFGITIEPETNLDDVKNIKQFWSGTSGMSDTDSQRIEEVKDSPDDSIDLQSEPETIPPHHIVIFNEQDRIPKKQLNKYIDINMFDMGYHDQEDGIIVICYGTTKVYTSWEDMFKLPEYIDKESIEELNNLKQVAIRNFRKWMHDNPSLLPSNADPDSEFKPMLTGVVDTSTKYDGNKLEGKLGQ